MASDYKDMLDLLPRGVWMSSSVMDHAWKTTTNSGRKYRVQQLVKKGLLLRKGNTGNTQYKVAGKDKPTESTKSTKSAESSLDSLIAAASRVGTENEILKTALKEAATAIARGLEAIK